MPELPEVETIKRELQRAVVGKRIIDVCVRHAKVIRQPSAEKFKQGLQGAKIKQVLRRAKMLVLELTNGKSLAIHLKMTGQLVLRQKLSTNPELVEGLVYPGKKEKNCRVSFHLSDGRDLDFNDQRLFAELRLMDDWHSLKFIQGLGPEPFDITAERFQQMLSQKKTKIKPLLMDQGFISGIGNLYAAEILFRAGINPARSAAGLSHQEKEKLFKEMVKTLQDAIKHRGSSVDQYVQLNGSPGAYIRYHKVYGRQGKPCYKCKTPIKRVALGGRGTYFCPQCQK